MGLWDKAKKATGDVVNFSTLGLSTGTTMDRLFGGKADTPDIDQAALDQALADMASAASTYEGKGASTFDPMSSEYVGDFDYTSLDPNSLIQLGDSGMAGITTDPRYRDAEMAALAGLSERSSEGLTLQDEANLARIGQQSAAANRGAQGAIEANFAQRGVSNSGMEFAAAQQAAQNNAAEQGMRGLEIAAQNQQQQRDATMSLGQLSSTLQGRDWSQQAAAAQAQDAINRFNTGFQVEQQMKNNQGINEAALGNIQRQQQNTQFNTGQSNQAAGFNAGQTQGFNTNVMEGAQRTAGRSYDSATDRYNRAAGIAAEKNRNRNANIDRAINVGAAGAKAYAGSP